MKVKVKKVSPAHQKIFISGLKSKKRKKTYADFLLEQEDKSIDRAIGTLRALAQKKRQEAMETAAAE